MVAIGFDGLEERSMFNRRNTFALALVVAIGTLWILVASQGGTVAEHPGDTPGGEGKTSPSENAPSPPCPDCGAKAGDGHRYKDPYWYADKDKSASE